MGKSKINFKSKNLELIVSSDNMTFMNKALELITSQLGEGKVTTKLEEYEDSKAEVTVHDNLECTCEHLNHMKGDPNHPVSTEHTPYKDPEGKRMPPIRILMCEKCGDFIVFNKNSLSNPNEFTCKKCGGVTKVVPDDDNSLDVIEYDCPCCGASHVVTTDTSYTELYVKCRMCKVPLDLIWDSNTGEFDVFVSEGDDEY